MLNNSLFGKLYIYWCNSVVFRILAAVMHCLDNAWENSLVKALIFRRSKTDEKYRNGFISGVTDGIFNFVLKCVGTLKPAVDNSFFVRLVSGSVFLNPDFMLGAFVCFMFVVPHSMWRNAYALLASLALFCLYLALCAFRHKRFAYPKEFGAAFFVFACITAISPIYSTEPADSRRVMLFFVTAFLLMWIVAGNVDSKEKLRTFMGWIYLSLILVSLYALAQRAMGLEVNAMFIDAEMNPDMPSRVFSSLDNPNNLAEFIVLFSPAAYVYASREKNPTKRLILCGLLGAPALAIVMTYSRGGWLSIALAVALLVFFENRRIFPWIFIAAILMVPFLPASVLTRLGNMFNTQDSSAGFRLTLWKSCLELLSMDRRWLTGIGLGPAGFKHNLGLVTTQYIAESMAHTQMLYMELFMEWGLLGFLSGMGFMIGKVKDAFAESFRSSDGYVSFTLKSCVCAFAGISIISIFEYVWFYPRILFAFFVIMGLLIASLRISKEERNEQN